MDDKIGRRFADQVEGRAKPVGAYMRAGLAKVIRQGVNEGILVVDHDDGGAGVRRRANSGGLGRIVVRSRMPKKAVALVTVSSASARPSES